jgi:hypothetical protein
MAKPAPQGGCGTHAKSQAERMGAQKPYRFCSKLCPGGVFA